MIQTMKNFNHIPTAARRDPAKYSHVFLPVVVKTILVIMIALAAIMIVFSQ